MSGAVVRSQLRRAGAGTLLTPLVVAVAVVLVGCAAASSWSLVQSVTLMNWLVQLFSITAGIAVAVVVTGERLVEMHESTPTSYRRALLLRAAATVGSAVAAAAVMFVPLHLLGVWPRDDGWVSLIVPTGAVVFLGAVALAVAAFSGTVAATTIAVVAAWMFLAMLWDPYVLPLYLQRGIPLLVAAGLTAIAWVRLADAERNLTRAVAA